MSCVKVDVAVLGSLFLVLLNLFIAMKTTNKSAKFETLNGFCLLFRTGI